MNTEQKKVILRFDKELVRTHISPRHVVNDSGRKVMYRLAKGESSLVEKDQSEFAEPYRLYISSQEMIFEDQTEVDFLKSKPYFGSLIKEFDPAEEHKKNNEVFNLTVDTFIKVRNLEDSEKRGLGYRLFGIEALKLDPKELENRIQSIVNDDPSKVNAMIEEKNDTDYALIGLAMAKDIIYEADAGTKVRFTDTDELITSLAQNQRPIDAVAELFKTGEGKELKKRIWHKMQPAVVEDIKTTKTTVAKGKEQTEKQ